MNDLLDLGPVRAGLFFAAGFIVATVLGIVLGDLQQGLVTGVSAGLVVAIFGYLFVRPVSDSDRDKQSAK